MNGNIKYFIAGGLVCLGSSALWFGIGVKCGIKLLTKSLCEYLSKELDKRIDASDFCYKSYYDIRQS